MSVIGRLAIAIGILALLPAFGSGERLFAPSADPWPHWSAHDPDNRAVIDHSVWSGLLSRHVQKAPSGVNLVDYQGFSNADRAALKDYIAALSDTPIGRYDRDQQLAYWINLYNAATVDLVLDNYPLESIRDLDISPGLFSSGPWGKVVVSVDGRDLSLNDIEHRILRPIWRDPGIHYAVNCASISCPNLAPVSYEGATAAAQMDAAARDYVNDPRGVLIKDGQVTVSRIYDWFIEDFGGSEEAVLAHLVRHAEPGLKAKLQEIGAIAGTHYDWSINAAR